MASCVCPELMNISFCWLVNSGVSVCRSSWENVVYKFILASPTVPCMSRTSYEMGGLYNCYFVGCCFQDLFKTASFFTKCFVRYQVLQSYCNTDMKITWKNSHFILSGKSDFHIVLTCQWQSVLPMYMLRSLLVDVILLPRYISLSTNFRGLLFNEEIAPSWLIHMNPFIWVQVETNTSCCLLQVMLLQRFSLSKSICKKY